MEDSYYIGRLRDQLWSFTEAMAEAIDARTPYNATHVRKVAQYSGLVADYINKLYFAGMETEFFSIERREQLIMSALLHDVGKIALPTHVMNKSSRLEGKLYGIRGRFYLIQANLKINLLQGKITEEDYTKEYSELEKLYSILEEYDKEELPDTDKLEYIKTFFNKSYNTELGRLPVFDDSEKECIAIEKGTLSEEERKIIEAHVEYTNHILNRVNFFDAYKDVPKFAALHHEMLDGSGYPNHLTAKDLPLEARILAVCDVCDALLATDRPYKSPLEKTDAFKLLKNMAAEGKLDEKIVNYLIACIG